ncbi:MAG: WD40 repeat domain-containing protein [Candidatus Omnitrophica bacterium]|nr:WD40 repeat domain-containing protein [Candidatus Omnitrophota bacterium]
MNTENDSSHSEAALAAESLREHLLGDRHHSVVRLARALERKGLLGEELRLLAATSLQHVEEAARLKEQGLALREEQEFEAACECFARALRHLSDDPELPGLLEETRRIPELRKAILGAFGRDNFGGVVEAAEALREIGFMTPRLERMAARAERKVGVRRRGRFALRLGARMRVAARAGLVALLVSGLYWGFSAWWPELYSRYFAAREIGGHGGGVCAAFITRDGRKVVASSTRGPGEAIQVWDAYTEQPLSRWEGRKTWVRAAALSPNARFLLTGGSKQDLIRREDESMHPDPEQHFSISLWDLESGKETVLFEAVERSGAQFIQAAAFSPSGEWMAFGVEDSVRLFETHDQTFRRRLRGHETFVRCLEFAPEDRLLVSGGMDGTLLAWDPESGAEHLRFAMHSSPVTDIAFSPSGKLGASSGWDNTVAVWEAGSGEVRSRLRGHRGRVNAVVFLDETTLLSGGGDGQLIVWDLATGEVLRRLSGGGSDVLSISTSAEGRYALTATESRIRLWDFSGGRLR